jgi:hypothetical protein
MKHWGSRNLNEWDSQSIYPVSRYVSGLTGFPSGILLERDLIDGYCASVDREQPVQCYYGGTLKSSCIRTVDNDLPHDVNFVNWFGVHQQGCGQANFYCFRIEVARRLFIHFYKAGGSMIGFIHYVLSTMKLKEGRFVYLT